LEFVKILIFITVDIFKHTAKKNKKIKRADQILPEVYGTTLTWVGEEIMYLTDVLPSLVIHCSSNLMETKMKFIKA
jgi:uncharacterized membrane protein SirB2